MRTDFELLVGRVRGWKRRCMGYYFTVTKGLAERVAAGLAAVVLAGPPLVSAQLIRPPTETVSSDGNYAHATKVTFSESKCSRNQNGLIYLAGGRRVRKQRLSILGSMPFLSSGSRDSIPQIVNREKHVDCFYLSFQTPRYNLWSKMNATPDLIYLDKSPFAGTSIDDRLIQKILTLGIAGKITDSFEVLQSLGPVVSWHETILQSEGGHSLRQVRAISLKTSFEYSGMSIIYSLVETRSDIDVVVDSQSTLLILFFIPKVCLSFERAEHNLAAHYREVFDGLTVNQSTFTLVETERSKTELNLTRADGGCIFSLNISSKAI